MISILASAEPEPQHDRPADVPPSMPPLPQRDPGRTLTTDPRHGELLLRLVREGDARAAAAGRTVPRTRAAMQARLNARMADDACGLCGYWTCRCGSASTAVASVAVR